MILFSYIWLLFALNNQYLVMVYHIGINDIEPNHWVAWVFDFQGCFAKAYTHDDAIASVPGAIEEYFHWLKKHHHSVTTFKKPIESVIAEDIKSFALKDGYFSNAFFEDDRRPLSFKDINDIEQLLIYTRNDLLDAIKQIPPEQMDKPIKKEVKGSIRGILEHIAGAEWWYFDRLDLAFNWDDMPDDILPRLERVRHHTISLLPTLVGKTQVVEKRAEKWSARKVIRRTLWHEIAHTKQILRYLYYSVVCRFTSA